MIEEYPSDMGNTRQPQNLSKHRDNVRVRAYVASQKYQACLPYYIAVYHYPMNSGSLSNELIRPLTDVG